MPSITTHSVTTTDSTPHNTSATPHKTSFTSTVRALYTSCFPICKPIKPQLLGKFNLKHPFSKTHTPSPVVAKRTLADLLLNSPQRTQSPEQTNITPQISKEQKGILKQLGLEIEQAIENAGEIIEHDVVHDMLVKQFTTPRISQFGHKNPTLIRNLVESKLEQQLHQTPQTQQKEMRSQHINAFIAEKLQPEIQQLKAQFDQPHQNWHQLINNNELINTLATKVFGDDSIELGEGFDSYAAQHIKTHLNAPEHFELNVQIEGETIALPGHYIQTKNADWCSNELPKVITDLKTRMQQEIKTLCDKIAPTETLLDWEDLASTEKLSDRLQEHFTTRSNSELGHHCPELIALLARHAIEAPEHYTAQEVTTLTVRGKQLKEQGKAWRTSTFPKLARELEKTLDTKIQKFLNSREAEQSTQTWDEFVQQYDVPSQMNNHLTKHFRNELGFHVPDFVKHLMHTKPQKNNNHFFYHETKYGSKIRMEARESQTSAFLEETIHSTILKIQKHLFKHNIPWSQGEKKIEHRLPKKLQKDYALDMPHTALAHMITTEALQHAPSYEHFSTNQQFDGGYFKRKNPQTNEQFMQNTQIMSTGGTIYELLNTLTPQDSTEILKQHNQIRDSEKTVIGQGSFGKVRFAQNTDTGEIVAVKKMASSINDKNQIVDNRNDTEAEVKQIKRIQDRIHALPIDEPEKQKIESLFALMEDYAHLTLPMFEKQGGPQSLILGMANKSYIFSPLANLGDGFDATNTIYELRNSQNPRKRAHAGQRYLRIAKNYIKAIAHLHALGLHHRDIKPENFLHSKVTQEFKLNDGSKKIRTVEQIKLADFGFTRDKSKASRWGGETPEYSSPEAQTLYRKTQYNAQAHDLFSLGMTLLNMKLGTNPHHYQAQHLTLKTTQGSERPIELRFYSDPNDEGIQKKRCQGVFSHRLRNLDMTHMDNIIAKLIARKPSDRITAEQALHYIEALEPTKNHLV